MTLEELKAFCTLLMCSDPWPTSEQDRQALMHFANIEAVKFDFDNWIEAYHGIP